MSPACGRRGRTSLEIQIALDNLRDRHRQEEEAQTMAASMRNRGLPPADIRTARHTLEEIHKAETDADQARNDGLPPELRTYPSRARGAVIGSDEKLREALAAGTILIIHFAAHHLIPMKAVHRYLDLFKAAARAGWRPDEAANLIGLPRNGDAQTLMEDALGEKRGVHDSGHPKWNEDALGELDPVNQNFEAGNLSDVEARREIEHIQKQA